ncbi:MAG: hypothetical protein CVV34_04630, partial [Methanomicrobiales archaeon HGW-Methanomicrobiales-5]
MLPPHRSDNTSAERAPLPRRGPGTLTVFEFQSDAQLADGQVGGEPYPGREVGAVAGMHGPGSEPLESPGREAQPLVRSLQQMEAADDVRDPIVAAHLDGVFGYIDDTRMRTARHDDEPLVALPDDSAIVDDVVGDRPRLHR